MPKMLEAALAYAERGWPVFPCRKTKAPYTANGVHDATTDPGQIEEWWARWPSANIGFCPGNVDMLVLDLDPGHNVRELEENVGPIPRTKLRVSTPRGGEHLYFALASGEIVSPSASKLAPHVDVRSFNSYVLLPPSRTADGEYAWLGEGKPAYRTDELIAKANAHREKSTDRDNWIVEADLDENVAAYVRWLKEDAKPAVEGRGGDHVAYATAAMGKSYGISPETALELMWEHWNPRCAPPWGADEADHFEAKVDNGFSYNTSPPGNMTAAYQVAKAAEDFKPVVERLHGDDGQDAGRQWKFSRFRIMDHDGTMTMPAPEFLIDDIVPENAYVLLYGEPSTGKTFVALDMALSVAAGFPLNPTYGPVLDPGPVVYFAGEGRASIAQRVRAWEALHYDSQPVRDFYLGDPVPGLADDVDLLVENLLMIQPTGFRMVVLDTAARALQGTDENKMENVTALTRIVERLTVGLNAAVVVVHHTGRSGKNPRGSSAFEGDADVMLHLSRVPKTMTVAMTMSKIKDGAEWAKPKFIDLRKHEFGMDGASSLAAMPAEKIPSMPKTDHTASQISTGATLDDPVNEKLIRHMRRRFKSHALGQWSVRNLATWLASSPEIDLTVDPIRRRLTAISQDVMQDIAKHYDRDTNRWLAKPLSADEDDSQDG